MAGFVHDPWNDIVNVSWGGSLILVISQFFVQDRSAYLSTSAPPGSETFPPGTEAYNLTLSPWWNSTANVRIPNAGQGSMVDVELFPGSATATGGSPGSATMSYSDPPLALEIITDGTEELPLEEIHTRLPALFLPNRVKTTQQGAFVYSRVGGGNTDPEGGFLTYANLQSAWQSIWTVNLRRFGRPPPAFTDEFPPYEVSLNLVRSTFDQGAAFGARIRAGLYVPPLPTDTEGVGEMIHVTTDDESPILGAGESGIFDIKVWQQAAPESASVARVWIERAV